MNHSQWVITAATQTPASGSFCINTRRSNGHAAAEAVFSLDGPIGEIPDHRPRQVDLSYFLLQRFTICGKLAEAIRKPDAWPQIPRLASGMGHLQVPWTRVEDFGIRWSSLPSACAVFFGDASQMSVKGFVVKARCLMRHPNHALKRHSS